MSYIKFIKPNLATILELHGVLAMKLDDVLDDECRKLWTNFVNVKVSAFCCKIFHKFVLLKSETLNFYYPCNKLID